MLKNKLFNVLVYPGGTEIGLEIARSLRPCKEVNLISAGLLNTPAEIYFQRHYEVQTVKSHKWLEELKDIIRDEGISHLFPAHDEVILPLVENANKLGVKVITSCLETCRTARQKSKTLNLLRGILPVPRIYDRPDDVDTFPVFLKPDIGQGSKGTAKAFCRKEIEHYLAMDESLLIQEFLPGTEYTVDCFSDSKRGVIYAGGRERTKITNGIASRSRFTNDPRFLEYAHLIHSAAPFRGAWFFQLKVATTGELKLLEVAPRIAGTSGLSRVSGINLPLLSLYESNNVEVTIPKNMEGITLERALTPAYYYPGRHNALYLDYDDTLIIDGNINSTLIRLLFQYINMRKPVMLVTRHSGNLYESLRYHRVEHLFDGIIHLKNGESKKQAIQHTNCLFIEDSFAEIEDLRTHPEVTPLHVSAVDLVINNHGN
jgi:carbamoyl-phosphate synthase large subunit